MALPVEFIFFKRKVYYENKKNTSRWIKGGAIIVSNHKSLFDFATELFLFPCRRLYTLMSELIFKHGPFVSCAIKLIGGVKIDRPNHDYSFLNKALNLLKKKKLVLIYPEGRVEPKGQLVKFQESYILLALKSGKPIIPIYTDGRYGLFKRNHIMIGDKIFLRKYIDTTNPTKEELAYFNEIIVKKMRELGKRIDQELINDKYSTKLTPRFLLTDLGRNLAKLFNIHFRMKIKNKKFRKIKGPCIVVSNHKSFADPLMLYKIFPHRRIYTVTAEVVFDGHKVRSYLLRKLGCVRINRKINDYEAYKTCQDILSAGNILVIFAQGQLSRDDSSPFKSGAALLASKTNVPIYPMLIEKGNFIHKFKITLGDKYDINQRFNKKRLDVNDLNLATKELQDIVFNLNKADRK